MLLGKISSNLRPLKLQRRRGRRCWRSAFPTPPPGLYRMRKQPLIRPPRHRPNGTAGYTVIRYFT